MSSTTSLHSDKIMALSREVTDVFVVTNEGRVTEKMFKSIDPARDLTQLIIWMSKTTAAIRTELPKARFAVLHYTDKKLLLVPRDNYCLGVVINKSCAEGPILTQLFQTLGWSMSDKTPGNDTNAKKRTPFIMDLGGPTRSPFAAKPAIETPTQTGTPEKQAESPKPSVRPLPDSPGAQKPVQIPVESAAPAVTTSKTTNTPTPKSPKAEEPQPKKGSAAIVIAIAAIVLVGAGVAYIASRPSNKEITATAQKTANSTQAATEFPKPAPVTTVPKQETTAVPTKDWRSEATSLMATSETFQVQLTKLLGKDATAIATDLQLANAEAQKAANTGNYESATQILSVARAKTVAALQPILQTKYEAAINDVPIQNARTYRSPRLDTAEAKSAQAAQSLAKGEVMAALTLHAVAVEAAKAWKADVAAQILTLARTAAANKEIETGKFFYLELLKLDRGNADALAFLHRYYYRAGQTIANSIGIKLAFIPPGECTIGSPSSENGRDPDETAYTAVLTRGYFIGMTEVTQGQWAAIMGDPTPKVSADKSQGSGFIGANMPMHSITYAEAVTFCEKLSAKEKRKYRLPTEAEWEHAARGDSKSAFGNGRDSLTPQEANIYDPSLNRESPVAAGSLRFRNSYGMADTMGNVWEWCSDWYGPYPTGVAENPTGPTTVQSGRADLSMRVVRGGSWNDDATAARTANRWQNSPVVPTNYIGFRIIMEISDFQP
ncbi:MAG: SUMF1/EgtB/PvdO family nonheme iron enzyme [Verrucomicrobiota bacterium]|nr:SUMF1/EgtB/PvdO family nonheme iron enzyme [Verrucomicrobiota bacterium]